MPSPRLKRLAAWLRSSTRLGEDGGRAWPQVVDSPTATQTRHEVCSHGWRMGWWHGLDKQHQLWHSATGTINVTNFSRNVSSTFFAHKEKILRNEKCPRAGGKKKDKMAQFMKLWSDVRKPPETLADSLKTRPPQETTLGNQLQSWLHTLYNQRYTLHTDHQLNNYDNTHTKVTFSFSYIETFPHHKWRSLTCNLHQKNASEEKFREHVVAE